MPGVNALSATTDINTVVAWVNQAAAGGAPIAPETFYSLQLLETIRLDASHYIYYKQADSAPIQNRADKLQLRRWSALQGHTTPLTEGVPPLSDKGSVEKYELEAFQYGRYMEFDDKVDFKVVDPVIAHYTKEYSLVAMETLDMLARDALLLNAQKYFAGGLAGMDDLTFANGAPNMTDLRKIVLAMKKNLVQPRMNGKYLVIGSPEFYYDMINDTTVKSYMTINQSTYNTMDGGNANIPSMFGLAFEETMVVPTSGQWVDSEGNKRLKFYKGTIASPTISTSDDATNPDLSEETGATVYNKTTGYVKDVRTNQDASYIPNQDVWTLATDAKEFKVQHIMILGKDALTRTGLSGEDNAKMYVKPLGSSGVLDPIDQRQSIGFKINSVGFGSTRPEAIYDYVCVPTMVNV